MTDKELAWIEALQDWAFEQNMDVDWETLKLVPISTPSPYRDDGDRTPFDYQGYDYE